MAVTNEQVSTFCSRILNLEEQKADIAGQIRDAFKDFVEEHSEGQVKPFTKSIKKTYKNYKELQKNRAEFVIVEAQADRMTEALLGGE